jgi:N-acetylneuraminic acid mutarotase
MYIINGVDHELIDEIYQEILELEKEIEDEKYDGCK